jgi:branched-subunit amino acid aminotransferase/4-amino-4-deoxychorismate lyase
MIWVGGRVVPDDDLKISVLDRTFEHGLGLFETLRTWNGHPTLLDRHLARLTLSAQELGLPLDPAALPDAAAVASLLRADGIGGDGMLRITLSGGLSEAGGSVLWMRSSPLPPPTRPGGVNVLLGDIPLVCDHLLSRHKTLNYWLKRQAMEWVQAFGADEALLATADGRIWEGSRTNLFLVRGGTLVTPGRGGPVLSGIMRSLVLERAEGEGITTIERDVTIDGLDEAEEVFLTNAVRGVIPVGWALGRSLEAPGPVTDRLWSAVSAWLERGGETP